MKITWSAITVLCLAILSPSVFAQTAGDYAYLCNDCTPAETLADVQFGGDGDYFIYDFVQSKITHYSVTGGSTHVAKGPTGQLAPNITQPRKVTVVANTSAVLAVFSAAQQLYNANGGSVAVYASSTVTIAAPADIHALRVGSVQPLRDANGYMNAFDMYQTPALQAQAINTNVANHVFPDQLEAVIGSILNTFFDNSLIHTPIQVYSHVAFPDGSTSVLQYDYATQTWTYVPGSSKDAFGNPIPETSVNLAGGLNSARQYLFPGTAAGNSAGAQQIRNANLLGVNVPVVSYNDLWIMACTNVANQTHCVTSLYGN